MQAALHCDMHAKHAETHVLPLLVVKLVADVSPADVTNLVGAVSVICLMPRPNRSKHGAAQCVMCACVCVRACVFVCLCARTKLPQAQFKL